VAAVPSAPPRWQVPVLAAGLALVVVVLFWPALRGGFVNYDDPDYLTANRHVQAGLAWDSVRWAFTTGHASNWHPLTWLSHLLDWQLFRERPAGHHFVSVALHALNAVLAFLAFRALTGRLWRSLAVAALFALHPLRVESVAWLSERKDVLSTAFWLLAMLAYAAYAKSIQRQRADGSARGFLLNPWYLLTALCLALGLMAKPMLVTLPCVLLLLDVWPLRRVGQLPAEGAGETMATPTGEGEADSRESQIKGELAANRAGREESWAAVLLEKLPLFALVVGSSVITFLVQRAGGAVSPLTGLPLTARLANALVSYVRYLAKFLWPTDLAVLYPHPGHWPVAIVAGCAAVVLALTVGVLWLRRRQPWLAVGWLWYLGTLVPVIGIVQVGIQSMADRYTYVPMFGIAVAVVWGAVELGNRSQGWRAALAVASVLYAALCLVLTREQIAFWRDSEALFRRTVAVTKNNYLAYNNLGFDFSSQGRLEEAKEMYEKSLAINPNYEEARNNLGYALAKLGRPAEAIPHYEAAIRLKPSLAEAHNNLGNALADLGRAEEARACYRRALELKPEHADAHNNLGIALAMQGKFDEAIEHLETSLRLKPKNASAHGNLGNAYAVQRKFDEAARHYAAALELNPRDAQTHNNLGNILAEQAKLPEAVAEYERALALNAKNPEAQFNLGMVLLRQGNNAGALSHFREALRLKPDYAEAKRQAAALEAQTR
jgi:tetratricopeptide (TPR) repeat protein